MKVLTTPMPVRSASRLSWTEARLRIAPLPAMISGLLAPMMTSTAWATALWSAPGRRVTIGAIGAPFASEWARSSGSSTSTAPGFSVSATLKALRTISGILSGCRTVCAHFVMGRNMETESMFWWLSLWSRAVSAWPMMQTSGARSMLASATPVTRLVAPGPRVPRQTPDLPVRRP